MNTCKDIFNACRSGKEVSTKSPYAKYAEIVLGFSAFISFLAFVMAMYRGAFYFPFLIDDAFTATVAKNWAMGDGFASSYGKLRVFDPEITTGPGLLAPLALAIRYLGNEVWVARVIPLTLNLALLGLILYRLRSWLSRQEWLWLLLILPLWYSRITADMWFTPLGDITAFLYIALAAIFASDALESGRRSLSWLSGFLAGLAVLTKTASWTALSGLLLLPVLYALLWRKESTPWHFIFYMALAMLSVLIPWMLYEHYALARESMAWQLAQANESRYIFLTAGSGVAQLAEAWEKGEFFSHIKSLVSVNATHRIRDFASIWLWKYVVYITLLVFLSVGLQALFSFKKQISRRLLSLFFVTSGYLAWFFCFSWSVFDQHFLIGYSLVLIVISLAVVRSLLFTVPVSLYLLLAVFYHNDGPSMFSEKGYQITIGEEYRIDALPPEKLIFRGFNNGKKDFIGDVYWPNQGENLFRMSMDRLIAEIERKWPEEKLAGWGWTLPYEVEYRLPGNNRLVDWRYLVGVVGKYDDDEFLAGDTINWADYYRALGEFIEEKSHGWPTGTTRAKVKWTGSVKFLLMLTPMDRVVPNSETAHLAAFCSEIVYDDGFYALYRCNRHSLEGYVNAKNGIDFYPAQWKEEWLLYRAGGFPAS